MSAGDQVTQAGIEGNAMSEIEQLKRDVAALKAKVLALGSLDSATDSIGSVTKGELRFTDDIDGLRLLISGKNLQDEIGVSAYLAGFAANGVTPTTWMDADTGDMTAAGGNARMTDRGFIVKQIPLIFEESGDVWIHLLLMNGGKSYDLLINKGLLDQELIGGGDFETGWETYWSTLPTAYEMIAHGSGEAISIISGELKQIADTIGGGSVSNLFLVTMDVMGDVSVVVQNTIGQPNPVVLLSYTNSFSAWTTITLVYSGNLGTPGYPYYLLLSGGKFDNVSIKEILPSGATGLVYDGNDGIFTYGYLYDRGGTKIWGPPVTTAINDFQVSNATGQWIKKTLAEVVTILRTVLDGIYAALAHVHAGEDITSGTVGTARLGSGTPSATNFLRGDQTWETPSPSPTLILTEQASAPATPAAGTVVAYVDNTSTPVLKVKDDTGAILTQIDSRQFITNRSTSNQSGFATDTYLAGSQISMPADLARVGMVYHLKFDMTKTAAGTATPTISIRFGTAGTTADVARFSFTFANGTAAIDTGIFEVWAHFRSVGASAIMVAYLKLDHLLAATGLTAAGAAGSAISVRTSAAFASTVANSIIGASFNGGLNFSGTNVLVQAELYNTNVP